MFGGGETPRDVVAEMEEFLASEPDALRQGIEQDVPETLRGVLKLPWGWTGDHLRGTPASLDRIQRDYHTECEHYLRVVDNAEGSDDSAAAEGKEKGLQLLPLPPKMIEDLRVRLHVWEEKLGKQ